MWNRATRTLFAVATLIAVGCMVACSDPAADWQATNDEAKTAHAEGRLEDAETSFRQNIERAEQIGPLSVELVTSLNNLGEFYRATGRHPEALPLYERALEINEQRLEANDPELIESYSRLAMHHQQTGNLGRAAELFERELLKREELEDAAGTITVLNNLGLVLYLGGDLDGAQQRFEHAEEIAGEALLDDHPSQGLIQANLSQLHRVRGDLGRAKTHLESAIRIAIANEGERSLNVARSRNQLGEILLLEGDFAGARRLHADALQIVVERSGPQHVDVAKTLNLQAAADRRLKRYSMAEEAYARAVEILDKQPPGPDLAAALYNQARLLSLRERYDQAAPLFQRSLELHQQIYGEEHAYVSTVRSGYEECLRGAGRVEEADALAERANG
ncbi:MAG: tetratricopeptide repeat protein [bacterium]|nr:tetratricopeptide repeat protein [bacterium]